MNRADNEHWTLDETVDRLISGMYDNIVVETYAFKTPNVYEAVMSTLMDDYNFVLTTKTAVKSLETTGYLTPVATYSATVDPL